MKEKLIEMVTRTGLYKVRDCDIEKAKNDSPVRREVEFCKKWIIANCEKQYRFNYDYSSYGLKHMVERDSVGPYGMEWYYICNGSFIQAAHELGYKYKPLGPPKYPACGYAVFNIKLIGEDITWHDAEHNPKRVKILDWDWKDHVKNMQIHWKLRKRDIGEYLT